VTKTATYYNRMKLGKLAKSYEKQNATNDFV